MSKQEEQQRQPNPHICKQHLFALDAYLNKGFTKVEELGPVVVIATPEVLFGRHITKKPINSEEAIKLVIEAKRKSKDKKDKKDQKDQKDRKVTTVFGDPYTFYSYPYLGVIISVKKVERYKVEESSKKKVEAIYEGKSWAIFKTFYHFHWSDYQNLVFK